MSKPIMRGYKKRAKKPERKKEVIRVTDDGFVVYEKVRAPVKGNEHIVVSIQLRDHGYVNVEKNRQLKCPLEACSGKMRPVYRKLIIYHNGVIIGSVDKLEHILADEYKKAEQALQNKKKAA